MSNGEELYAYLEKLAKFILDTNSISATLMHFHIEALQSNGYSFKEPVLNEYEWFEKLIEQAKIDGISDDSIFRNQVQTINSAFALFKDIVPELEELP